MTFIVILYYCLYICFLLLDVEELSARLNLMVTSGELGDNLEPNTGTINDGNYLSNHCVYLEQLLGTLFK